MDAGFLELVRLGIKSPDDPLIAKSVKVVDDVIKVDTPNGPAFYRYNNDGYGEMDDGRRWNWDGKYTGKGRLWVLLSGERGQYELASGGIENGKLKIENSSSLPPSLGRTFPAKAQKRQVPQSKTGGNLQLSTINSRSSSLRSWQARLPALQSRRSPSSVLSTQYFTGLPALQSRHSQYLSGLPAPQSKRPPSSVLSPQSSAAERRLDHMLAFANEGLMIPEQVWDKEETPENIDRQFVPELKFGEGTGSATPLAWSMAQFIRLAVNLKDGRNLDTPQVVYDRYVKRGIPGNATNFGGMDEEFTLPVRAGRSSLSHARRQRARRSAINTAAKRTL